MSNANYRIRPAEGGTRNADERGDPRRAARWLAAAPAEIRRLDFAFRVSRFAF